MCVLVLWLKDGLQILQRCAKGRLGTTLGVEQVIVRDCNETCERLVQVKRSALPSHFLLQLAEITEDARSTSAQASDVQASDVSYIPCPTSITSGSASMAPRDQQLAPLAIRGVSNPVDSAPANAQGDAKGVAKGGGQPGQRGLCGICGRERAWNGRKTASKERKRASPCLPPPLWACVTSLVYVTGYSPGTVAWRRLVGIVVLDNGSTLMELDKGFP